MRTTTRVLLWVCLPLAALGLGSGEARPAECLLANPSFEVGGTGGLVFGGWEQFGVFGSSDVATHGSKSALLIGPDLGGWDVSGYWQALDCEPGEQWEASVRLGHTGPKPLNGMSKALVNIEWHDAGGMISYESYVAADASTPLDEVQDFRVISGPAPAGTVSVRLVLAVLQGPSDDPPEVLFDEATFWSLNSPTMDEQQWHDFPGGRTLEFGGRSWRVKGPGWYEPGGTLFCDDPACVWVDAQGRLHMTIQRIGGSYQSTEITLEEAMGYGDYVFTTQGKLDDLDPDVVLGMFLWQYGPCWDPTNMWWNPYNEIDVEISRWGDPLKDIAQFVAQPFDWSGNMSRFDLTLGVEELASFAFRWLPDRVEYRAWRGGPADEAPENMIHAWTYTGPHIPRPEQPRVHINLWQFYATPASAQEVILADFNYVPVGATAAEPSVPAASTRHLSVAAPNPFNPRTMIRYRVPTSGHAEIVVFDAAGRRVRTLVSGVRDAGEHQVEWDGTDDSGRRVASGVYLYRLRSHGVVETQRVVLVK